MHRWKERMRLDRKADRRGLHVPPTPDASHLASKGFSLVYRNVLYDAVGVREIELVIGKRQSLGRVGSHECSRVLGAVKKVDAGDREIRRLADQPEASASDVDDSRLGANRRQLPEPLDAAHPRTL